MDKKTKKAPAKKKLVIKTSSRWPVMYSSAFSAKKPRR